MRFSRQWLTRFLETEHSAAVLADALTNLGFEVEALDDAGAPLKACEVVEIAAVRPHPNADRLRLAELRSRRGKAVLVCGAPNLRAGMKTIWARPGAVLPRSGERVRVAEIRGTASPGMLCSEYELGLSEAQEGIVALPPETALGASAAAALGLEDRIFDVAIMPNRGDAMSVYGLARELAAAGLGRLKASPLAPDAPRRGRQSAPPSRCGLRIAAGARAACPHFVLCELSDIRVRPSPLWLQQHLRAAGLRPQSAPVDITNYVALSFGHPLHVYDADRVAGGIEVRLMGAAARTAPPLQGLDGRAHRLAPEDCVIADADKVLGIGGVMGGAPSACRAESRRLILESAWFAPAAIARTGQRLQCMSQARQRYERGVDAALTAPALAWAAREIRALCGGELSAPKACGAPPQRRSGGRFALAASAALTGQKLSVAAAKRTLTALGFSLSAPKGGTGEWHVRAPSWRYDISSDRVNVTAELTEEILRFADWTRWAAEPLPRLTPARRANGLPLSAQRAARVRRHLAVRGWDELVCWSFISEAHHRAFGGRHALRLANPLSEEFSLMRHTLIPNLAVAVRKNLARRMDWLGPVQAFELGPVFGPRLGEQRLMAAGVCAAARPRTWQAAPQTDMFFAMKAHVLAVLQDLGVPPAALRVEESAPPYYQRGRAAALRRGKTVLAWCGVLADAAQRALGLRGEIGLMELALDGLGDLQGARAPAARPTRRAADYPLVRRDFAFVCAASLPAAQLVAAACEGAEQEIARAHIFDVFALPDAPGHKAQKSLALEIVLAPRMRTLTDAEIQDFCARLVARVRKKTGAVLRREQPAADA